ncbi:MAG: hypothetical protein M1830_006761, partial [Pleopsidium flavum]
LVVWYLRWRPRGLEGYARRPLPKQRQQAHRSLDTVARRRGRRSVQSSEVEDDGRRRYDDEGTREGSNSDGGNLLEAPCPICLSALILRDCPLRPPPPSHGPPALTPQIKELETQSIEVVPRFDSDPECEDEQDILTLRACNHTSHAACIASWFLLRR